MTKLKVSVIIPCYNEHEVIAVTHERVKRVLIENFSDHEILYINDGSKDNTLEIIGGIAKSDPKVKVLSFSRNFGHQPAVTCGIHHCTGDVAIIIDADLQDPPELFPEMVARYQEGFNVVFGMRKNRKGENFFKKITAKLFYRFINWLSEVKLPLDTGDFRLIDRKVIDAFCSMKESRKYIRGLISWIGFKQTPIYYERDARFAGETKYTLSKMIKFATTGMLYFSNKPLKLAMSLGFVSIAVGLILSVYVIISKFSHWTAAIPGWASTLIIIIFFGGVQLLTIGVMGEYIGGIFDEIKGRPEYIVGESWNVEKK
jgi:dolichol-phosphate mannosyltransferase